MYEEGLALGISREDIDAIVGSKLRPSEIDLLRSELISDRMFALLYMAEKGDSDAVFITGTSWGIAYGTLSTLVDQAKAVISELNRLSVKGDYPTMYEFSRKWHLTRRQVDTFVAPKGIWPAQTPSSSPSPEVRKAIPVPKPLPAP